MKTKHLACMAAAISLGTGVSNAAEPMDIIAIGSPAVSKIVEESAVLVEKCEPDFVLHPEKCLPEDVVAAGHLAQRRVVRQLKKLRGLPLSGNTRIAASIEIVYEGYALGLKDRLGEEISPSEFVVLIDGLAAAAAMSGVQLSRNHPDDIIPCNPKDLGLAVVQHALLINVGANSNFEDLLRYHSKPWLCGINGYPSQ